ncbi:MAG: NAD(P)H-hydrate dehydratase [Pseudomonadota bacterium]
MDSRRLSIFSTADVRAIDRRAIEQHVDGYTLMTRAAAASLDVLVAGFSRVRRVIVLCGVGNNAGDGFVFARLAMADPRTRGWLLEVVAWGGVDRLTGDAATAWHDFEKNGGTLATFDPHSVHTDDVVVDALLGTGLDRPLTASWLELIQTLNDRRPRVLSLDVPSGLCSDSGQPRPAALHATHTATFIAPKPGLFAGQGARFCGQVSCHDLAVPAELFHGKEPKGTLIEARAVHRVLARRSHDAHKGEFGRVLIIGGHIGMGGAVMLSALAALRSGAGMVTVACHPDNRHVTAAQPEIMCRAVADVADVHPLIEHADVVAIGPGLGRDTWGEALLDSALTRAPRLVIDADALRLLATRSRPFSHPACVLTPHPGEAAALLGTTTDAVQSDRLHAASQLVERFPSVCVLKGASSIVLEPDALPAFCSLGNPGMATAGSGDVLTGIMAGIWAQGRAVQTAHAVAAASVFVHASAGDKAAVDGERGLIASDIIDRIASCVN